ncbi:sensor histidine kinase [Halonotius terrestris]|uniref:sensor histidine kinase n=1 Tax=Halonotius terrestris TaxID=2487750 RepID=UPI00163C53B7|nr:histidine kinase N-terminal 7TM domain-containing protein [Halonotius terrestris]
MFSALSWPAIGSLVSGLISLAFIAYVWPYREEDGATLFMAMIGSIALWAVSYGVALLVFDPTLRFLLEIPIWVGTCFTSLLFLAFALEYTGRKDVVRSKAMAGLVALMVGFVGLIATNPWHQLVWQNYRIEPTFGAATVAHSNGAWLFLILLALMILTAGAVLTLIETFVSYGRLYRSQTLALALSPVPVIPGILLWVFQVGPTPYLNLAPLLFPAHLGLDMYAFFRRNMFELTPAARRTGDQTAIDDLGIGVIIVDDDQRVINANESAAAIVETSKPDFLGKSLDSIELDIDLAGDEQRIRHGESHQRDYAVTVSSIEDSADSTVGHTITLQDITTERQREQRLAVLNRILRHNLRNDLNVASGYLEVVADGTENDQYADMLETAKRNTDDVLELGEKARMVERTLETEEMGTEPIPVAKFVDHVADPLVDDHGGSVDNEVPADFAINTNRQLLESVLANLIENSLEHGGGTVTVGATTAGSTARIEISDSGDGIPEHELSVIEEGKETDLEHGSGIGLWLVEWGATALGGNVTYETGPEGTTATVELPDVVVEPTGDG